MTRTKIDNVITLLLIGVVLLAIVLFAALARAEDKPATPTLTDAQKVVLLQAEVKVLTSQVENLQAKLTAADKEYAFQNALKDLYKAGETTAKAAGADKTDFDLDLNTLTFKQRPGDKPVVTPAPVKK